MRHEVVSAAIDVVREWFEGLSRGADVDAQVARVISTVLDAYQLSSWLYDHPVGDRDDSRRQSVDLLRAIAGACDVEAIRSAVDAVNLYMRGRGARG